MKLHIGSYLTGDRGEQPFFVDLSPGQFKHGLLLGKSGTGKSTFLRNIAAEALAAGWGLGMVEPHGDLIYDTFPYIPRPRIKYVNYLDPTNNRIPDIGIFDYPDPERAVQGVMAILEAKAGAGWGPETAHVLRCIIDAVIELCPHPSILDVYKVLVRPDYAAKLLAKSKNPAVWDFYQQYFKDFKPIERVRNFSHPLNKIEELMRPGLREFLCQKKSISFLHIMDNQQILLCRLPKGPMGQRPAQTLGSLIINKINLDSFRRRKRSKPFLMIIDEFHNFTEGLDVETMFAEARKYGVQFLVASQSLAQLRDEQQRKYYDEMILGNVSHIFSFRTSGKDAEQVALNFGSDNIAPYLVRLPNYHFAALATSNNETDMTQRIKLNRYPQVYASEVPTRKSIAWAKGNTGTPKHEIDKYITAALADGAPRPELP